MVQESVKISHFLPICKTFLYINQCPITLHHIFLPLLILLVYKSPIFCVVIIWPAFMIRSGGFGYTCKITLEKHDALISFMHLYRMSHTFHWPVRKNNCCIPEQQCSTFLLFSTHRNSHVMAIQIQRISDVQY